VSEMENRIRRTTVEVRRLSPAEAEVWVVAELVAVTPTTELRGRLVGPRCPGISTVEVPYPLRPPRERDGPPGTLTVRAVIPEPNLWTPATPFVYEGTLELWQDGERCDVATISAALKPAG
jgi:hypothetical protein